MMIPIAPSEVAARVNFAFVDIVYMVVAMERQLLQELATLREGASVEGRAWAPRLGGHHQHPPVANNHCTSGAVVT